MTPQAIVRLAEAAHERYGFNDFKLKAVPAARDDAIRASFAEVGGGRRQLAATDDAASPCARLSCH